MKRVFGEINGVQVGDIFDSRKELAQARVHRPLQAGISGSIKDGADSIVLSGGYEDDEDFGNEIIYTGEGGRDEKTGRQIADQKLKRGNRALAISKLEGKPVRVIRGYKHVSDYSPEQGYRYAGLYNVDDYWYEQGLSGYRVWRYRLRSIEAPDVYVNTVESELFEYGPTQRTEVTVQRIVRNSNITKQVKDWHQGQCQICGLVIQTEVGPYSEAAHIKPLGRPHGGPDVTENLLCLCPNHHVMFDYGLISINDDFTLNGIDGVLRTVPNHNISLEFITYHREHYAKNE